MKVTKIANLKGVSENGDHNLTLMNMHWSVYELAACVSPLFLLHLYMLVYFIVCLDGRSNTAQPEINRMCYIMVNLAVFIIA